MTPLIVVFLECIKFAFMGQKVILWKEQQWI